MAHRAILARPHEAPLSGAVRLTVSAPLRGETGVAGPAGESVVFVKLYDVDPGGNLTLPERLVSPVRVPVTDKSIQISLPGIVHRFAKGDRLELAVAGGDAAYRGNQIAQPVAITVKASKPSMLRLPLAGGR